MREVKTHKFKLGKYNIDFTGKLYGDTVTPHGIKNGKPFNYCWKDCKKTMWIGITKSPLEDLDTILHEALHAQGIPDKYLHDKNGDSETIMVSRFLWRLGYRNDGGVK